MTRDGLTEENLRDGSVKDISHRSRGRPEIKEEFVPERERKKAEEDAGDHRICGEARGQPLEDRQNVPYQCGEDQRVKPSDRQHDPAGRQADSCENGAGIELVPRVTVVRCCFLLKNGTPHSLL